MAIKTTVGIVYGGKSVEHQISINSATNIFQFIDKEAFDVKLIGIDKTGNWYQTEDVVKNINNGQPLHLDLNATKPKFRTNTSEFVLDAIFPVLHGTDGEDGSIQGLIKVLNLPTVGSGVLGSAMAMDKLVSKRLLEASGIPVAKYLIFTREQQADITLEKVEKALGLPVIVKPIALGSSVGVSKVRNEEELRVAIEDTLSYDNLILVEECIEGRELECAVMGNDSPKASAPGEIVIGSNYEFYSFDAKYVDPDAVDIVIPAVVDQDIAEEIKSLSIRSYQALRCEDYARIDLFLKENGDIFINEINTIPGFTNSSMFPMLWANDGIGFTELISDLINLAKERFSKQQMITTNYESKLD